MFFFFLPELCNFQILFCLRLTYRLVLILGVKTTALLDTTCVDRIQRALYSMWSHNNLQAFTLTNTLAFSIYFLFFGT